jgi:drug/metabolite transporter (DMT)-like permease
VSTATAHLAPKSTRARWTADLALALVALIWGATFVIVKRALADISTLYFLAIRFSLATLCMLFIFLGAFRRVGAKAVWRGLRGGAAAGVFLCLGYMLQTFGLRYTTAGKSGFLTGFYIVLVPVIGAAVFRRRPQRAEILGILVATAGIAVLTIPSVRGSVHINRGDLLTIGCAVAYAFHLLVLGYYSQREAFEAVALGQIACTALICTIALPFDPPHAVWNNAVILAIIVTAVFATAVAFALQTWGQARTSPNRTALIFALEPVFALLAAVLIGGEALTGPGILGSILILSGILAVELKPAEAA